MYPLIVFSLRRRRSAISLFAAPARSSRTTSCSRTLSLYFRKIIGRFVLAAAARSMTKRYCFSPCDPELPESAVAFTTYFLLSLSSVRYASSPVRRSRCRKTASGRGDFPAFPTTSCRGTIRRVKCRSWFPGIWRTWQGWSRRLHCSRDAPDAAGPPACRR